MFTRRPKIGELSHELFICTVITWKIPRHLILPSSSYSDIESPPFLFAGATWTLHAWPRGYPDYNDWINLGIQRLDSNIPEHYVFCKFHFKTNRGKEFEPFQATFTFNENHTLDYMNFTDKKDFLRKEKVVVKDGVLTIVCQMRTPKLHGIDAFSQVELLELDQASGIGSGSSEENFRKEPVAFTSTIYKESEDKSTQEPETSISTTCKDSDCSSQKHELFPDNKILEDFKALFLAQEDCDVIIKVKGREFSAHRTILRARSPVFASTFRNNMKEKATGIIDIEDCDPSSFSDFLYFLYCGKIENLTTENVFSLFSTADKYDIQDLRLQCLEFMKNNLSVDIFCDVITLAVQHFEKELIEFVIDFFAKHFQEIIVTVKWQSFLVENPIQGNEILIKALVKSKK